MKLVAIIAALAASLVAASFASAAEPGESHHRIEHDGRTRTYELYVPVVARDGKHLPLVIVLHGGLGTGAQTEKFAGLDYVAEREGFVVAYPNGTSPGPFGKMGIWNAGACCGAAHRRGIDDVGFIAAVIDEIAAQTPIDRRRVYATGLSNGAMMAYRLACELPDRIAAIAPVAGTMNVKSCNPSRPVPVIHFHGTADHNVPYDGGRGSLSISKFNYTSVVETIARWRAIDGCSDKVEASRVPDSVADETTVRIERWPECKDGSEVELVTIQGGGHTWPGGPYGMELAEKLGAVTMDISAAETMWAFFPPATRCPSRLPNRPPRKTKTPVGKPAFPWRDEPARSPGGVRGTSSSFLRRLLGRFHVDRRRVLKRLGRHQDREDDVEEEPAAAEQERDQEGDAVDLHRDARRPREPRADAEDPPRLAVAVPVQVRHVVLVAPHDVTPSESTGHNRLLASSLRTLR